MPTARVVNKDEASRVRRSSILELLLSTRSGDKRTKVGPRSQWRGCDLLPIDKCRMPVKVTSRSAIVVCPFCRTPVVLNQLGGTVIG